jgi:hypothetical protein
MALKATASAIFRSSSSGSLTSFPPGYTSGRFGTAERPTIAVGASDIAFRVSGRSTAGVLQARASQRAEF